MSTLQHTLGESVEDYTIGWICALQEELDTAARMLDEQFDGPESAEDNDNNCYVFGRIGKHFVVVGCLPEGRMGNSPAAIVAKDMRRSFPHLKFALMVGIGGGAPTEERDIRLGDVVVSVPRKKLGGVVQYDFGKVLSNGQFERTGHLNAPPDLLLAAIRLMRLHNNDPRKRGRIISHFQRMDGMSGYERPEQDRLYRSDFEHQGGSLCKDCGAAALVERNDRESHGDVMVHYGVIASGNSVMKDAIKRDQYAKDPDLGILCFEMEAGGLMNTLPCLVIRGICDYSDSHKNDDWHNYAALAAAAYAKELLLQLKPTKVAGMPQWAAKLEGSIREINEDVKFVRETVLDDQKSKIHRWLSAPDVSQNYDKALRYRQKGTGEWFVKSDGFGEWKSKPNSFLWLHGIPGCGKTVLTSTIIEEIDQACKDLGDQPASALAYFFFDFSDPEKQKHENMVRSLITQLSCQLMTTHPALQSLYSCTGDRQPDHKSLLNVLQEMVQAFDRTFIVVDAIDECPRTRDGELRKGVLQWIAEVNAWSSPKMHLLVTSRPELDIEKILMSLPTSRAISIQSSDMGSDIEVYVASQLAADPELKELPRNIRTEIKDTLTAGANGMFRWVFCQLDTLKQCLSPSSIRKALRSLPASLDDTYARILNNISKEYQEQARRALFWLAFSERPLRLEEVAEAAVVEPRTAFDPEERLFNPRDVLKVLGSLVTTSSKPVFMDDSDHSTGLEISLAHFSVKEYLVSERIQFGAAQKFRATDIDANHFIVKSCLSYIFYYDESDSKTTSHGDLECFPLLQYACQLWYAHVKSIPAGNRKPIEPSIFQLFLSDTALVSWLQVHRPDSPAQKSFSFSNDIGAPLYYASDIGLESVVQLLLDHNADANVKTRSGQTALHRAAMNGHEAVARLLIEKGADVETKDNDKQTALHEAAKNGHLAVVQLLVEKRADVEAKISDGKTALHAAAKNGHTAVARVLIEKGADIELKDMVGTTALYEAAKKGHLAVLQLLVEKGADVETTDNYKMTALHGAAANGHRAVVQLLLEKGANVEAESSSRQTPLHLAAHNSGSSISTEENWVEVVQLLVENGADINAKNSHGRTALLEAASTGHSRGPVPRVLLEKGADVNVRDASDGRTALHWAARYGQTELARMLLEKGADVEVEDTCKERMDRKSYRGNMRMIELRMQMSRDRAAKGVRGCTPLWLAVVMEHEGVVRLLRSVPRKQV